MAPEDPGAKYELRHQIGRGSFGSAFLVTNKQDKAEYVLKRVRLAKQTKWQRNSTLQERQLATSLRHPFIVPCVESWVEKNHTVHMIYAFCQNGDLSSYLTKIRKQEGQVEESVMQKWLCQLLLALDYLQTQRVLHRDIKTSNLMLTFDNDVQLGDFGLATLMEEDGDESRPQDSNLVGTPHYMSPELLSCNPYGFKTDVWSLGCVFYELTAQRPTFNAFNIHGLVSKIKKNKLAPLPSTYSTEWRDVVSLMLCKNPDRRPSVQQLMALPALRPAMLEARARALNLMPTVPLPPLLDPTPLTPQPLSGHCGLTGDQDVADGSEGSAGSASDQHSCSAGGGSETDSNRGSCRGDRRAAAGLAAAHAVDASELTELWKANFVNKQMQDDQLDTDRPKQQFPDGVQLAAPQQHHQQQQEGSLDQQCGVSGSVQEGAGACTEAAGSSAGGMQDGDSAAGCSPSSSARSAVQRAVDSKGLPAGYSPRNAVGVIDGYKRIAAPKPAHVNQPGIKRTPSQRVAAAIAAAGPIEQPAAAAARATGRVTPDLCARPAPASVLSKASRTSSSSRQVTPGTVTPGTVTPPQGGSSEAGSQSQLSPASVTPRLPSSTTKQPPAPAAAAGPIPRQDSGSRQHAQPEGSRARPSSAGSAARTATPGSGQAGTSGSSTAAAAGAAAKSSPAAARPLSAPRSSSVRRMSSGREGEGSSGGSARPQRPAWGAGGMGGGRSCLTPGRQRPDQSPLLRAAKAQDAAAAAAAPTPASAEAADGSKPDAAAALTTRRRSHGQLSPMPSARHSAHGSGSPATEGEAVARAGAPSARQQQQQLELLQRLEEHKRRKQQKERRSNSRAPDAAAAAAAGSLQVRDAGTPGQPAHGLPRSARHTTPGRQQQLGPAPCRPVSSKPQHRHSDPAGGRQLPPLALHKLHQGDSSNENVSATSPQLSPITLASPVYGQDRQEPLDRSSSWAQDTAGRQSRHSAPGTCSATPTAATTAAAAAGDSAAACGSLAQTPEAARRSSAGGSSSSARAAEPQPPSSRADSRQASSTRQQADVLLAAAVGSSASSRRVSLGSTGRRSSSTIQEVQDAADSPAPGGPSSGMPSRQPSGLSTPQRDHQQQQREQQQQSAPQQVPQPDQGLVQRMELLESALMVISGLVERRRWTELGAVLASEGLLASSMYPNLQYAPDVRQQQQQVNPSTFKLGDIVALGRNKSISGTIRYIGPVAWDTSGEDWAGMELDRPCGVDGTQRGLTYVQCQPNCASFHRMSEFTSLGA